MLRIALAASLPGAPANAQIKGRNISIIVPFSPGTGVDILARVIGEELQGMTGQPVVVETSPAPAAISAPTKWLVRRPMATRCC